MDDSIIDISSTAIDVIDVIDLTKESPRTNRPSRSQRRINNESTTYNINENQHFRRPLSPIILGNTNNEMKKPKKKKSRATLDEVLTVDDTNDENKTYYTVESDNGKPVPLMCPICFESLSSNLKPITTRCGHLFCTECLETFIQTTKKCPTCKGPITLKSCTRLYL
ncbi:E3 ubiquitin-protein ligase RNF4-like [Pogonomyrmex barbatus]|uniref:E3 ubiquitin-protein ligase RNF4-like n=1 Tax=Pogonomyrmex barbatus TaxID=144034 RepID=A0A6I9W019_9HYME|nr:E3 ubiquitin-protein ligase RNF4-like [Pogonomyrmex barbatus]XP_011634196.1 E3 ubiquitin-protein ligase RNF4-like [Pogonomyrmex barbatus]